VVFHFLPMPTKLPAKQKGEWAEVCFAVEVLRRGWRIARPYGDSAPYDCIVEAAGRLSRVQVKSVEFCDIGRRYPYRVRMGRGKWAERPYTSRDMDLMAVLVIPRMTWYIVPMSVIDERVSIAFGINEQSYGALEEYRDAWKNFET
jgi:hypothetical protein